MVQLAPTAKVFVPTSKRVLPTPLNAVGLIVHGAAVAAAVLIVTTGAPVANVVAKLSSTCTLVAGIVPVFLTTTVYGTLNVDGPTCVGTPAALATSIFCGV